jgi:hypothetical protein
LAFGALIGLLVLVAIALGLFQDVNAYKPRFETAFPDVFGPVTTLLEDVESLFPDGACEVFYAGSVAQPK